MTSGPENNKPAVSQHSLPAIQAIPGLDTAPPLSYAPIEELNDRHRAIAQMEIQGFRNKDIARELDAHVMTVYRVQNSPIYKVYISDLRKKVEEVSVFDAAKYLERITPKTMRTLENLMDNADSENVRVAAAKELFDRQMPKVSKTEHKEETVIHFGDSIQNLALALADNMRVDPKRLDGKSDEEVIDLLEGEIDAPDKGDGNKGVSDASGDDVP